ncbi:AbrB/MazE/SpoVT family DNA-binding domain-containing protein [Candidatus Bathyarchaeota archaeon]|nr:AbrB/MazE/SpoVT family DNA-binding domain-containing protein [Candidatus Bathyarchaeota archaeon]
MIQEREIKVGKKYALYLPIEVVKTLNLREGDRMLLSLSEGRIILTPIREPLDMALREGKFDSYTPEEVEAISLEEQRRRIGNSP